jgi:hypothetical protein
MKFVYIDESGTGGEPFAVMGSIIVDALRMVPTKNEWDDFLPTLSRIAGKKIDEFHTRDFYSGSGVWHGVPGDKRSEITDAIVGWIAERRHHIAITSVTKSDFEAENKAGQLKPELKSIWMTMASHLILSVQREFQSEKKNKGNSILVFDEHGMDKENIERFVYDPPEWTDSYYSKAKKQRRLDQIVDVPYFCNSKHVGLVQLADFVSFIARRYIEIVDGNQKEKYAGEKDKISGWFNKLQSRSISWSSIYPKTGRCEISEMYFRLAAPSLRILR